MTAETVCPTCGHRAHGSDSRGHCGAWIDNGWTRHGCHCVAAPGGCAAVHPSAEYGRRPCSREAGHDGRHMNGDGNDWLSHPCAACAAGVPCDRCGCHSAEALRAVGL